MDDFLLLASGQDATRRLRDAVDHLLSVLGLRCHPRKGQWELCQHLGLEIDTKLGLFRVSTARGAKIRRAAATLEVLATQRRRAIPAKQLAAFTGLAQSVYLAVPAARFFLRALHNTLSNKVTWQSSVRLD